jgi:D-alanyl-lipoteichoic acid acyltransferase DltB (MBOAT superfamily)
MIPQFNDTDRKKVNYENIAGGILVFAAGLAKKVLLADNLAPYADWGFSHINDLGTTNALIVSLAYMMQLYFDFSGYCDMAIGCALMFNIKLPINFNSPYKALNIQDFWRRWHMTLSRFLRDYLYIPLGGNRKGEARACANIFTVFLIGGLWHGAAWTFVIWGILHGLANLIYRLWRKTGITLNKFLAWFITFNFINLSWVFFRAKSFDSAQKVLSAMFDFSSFFSFTDRPWWRIRYYLTDFDVRSNAVYGLILILILCTLLPNSIQIIQKLATIKKRKIILIISICLAMLSVALLTKMIIIPYSEFIYFNF